MGLIKSLDIRSFEPEDIDFDKFERKDDAALNKFISDYLFSTDGKSVERLQNVIMN